MQFLWVTMLQESLGDYCAGPSHVLPTSGSARFSSPLGVYDFQKRTSVIMCDEESAVSVNQASSVMARGEGLIAHALSAEYRMADLKKNHDLNKTKVTKRSQLD